MKVNLMYQDHDFDRDFKISQHEQLLIQDLGLDTFFNIMANNDELISEVTKKALFSSLTNPAEILYRQDILKDCINNPSVVKNLYSIANEAIKRKREWYLFGISCMFISSVMSNAVNLLQMFVEMLKKLRKVADMYSNQFESKGLVSLFKMLQKELDDEYFSILDTTLNELKFRNGMLISAELGEYNQGINYVLRKPQNKRHFWLKWRFAPSLYIHPRDENGGTDLSKRKDRAINIATNSLAQSAEHVLSFFTLLQTELAFYVGCINLYEHLQERGKSICFPSPSEPSERKHSFKGLYDVSLALITKEKVIGNDINMDNKEFAIITGANQGGKSTFLQSIGQSQLMMQCGMFVGALSFNASICNGIFTHYKKEEDSTMESGKLEEELGRMSDIADHIKPNSLCLFNESFSATNEREGSEIGRQIVRALLEKHIKIFFVTHFYDFAHSFYEQKNNNIIFLRAERLPDGRRTFKIIEGEPLQTSYGEDIYYKLFKSDMQTASQFFDNKQYIKHSETDSEEFADSEFII